MLCWIISTIETSTLSPHDVPIGHWCVWLININQHDIEVLTTGRDNNDSTLLKKVAPIINIGQHIMNCQFAGELQFLKKCYKSERHNKQFTGNFNPDWYTRWCNYTHPESVEVSCSIAMPDIIMLLTAIVRWANRVCMIIKNSKKHKQTNILYSWFPRSQYGCPDSNRRLQRNNQRYNCRLCARRGKPKKGISASNRTPVFFLLLQGCCLSHNKRAPAGKQMKLSWRKT